MELAESEGRGGQVRMGLSGVAEGNGMVDNTGIAFVLAGKGSAFQRCVLREQRGGMGPCRTEAGAAGGEPEA